MRNPYEQKPHWTGVVDPRKAELFEKARVRPPSIVQSRKVIATFNEIHGAFPSKTVAVNPEPRTRHSLTQLGIRLDPGELYHEQSKFHPGARAVTELAAREQENISVFLDFVVSGFDFGVADDGETQNKFYDRLRFFPEPVQSLANAVAKEPRVLHGADLYLLFPYEGSWGLFRYMVQSDALSLVRQATTAEVEALGAHLLDAPAWTPGYESDAVQALPVAAFIVAAIGRSFLAYEDRGYRVAVLRAGELGSTVKAWAAGRGLSVSESDAFYDDDVNRFLGLEGLTKSAMKVVLAGARRPEAKP
ncbi:MAG: hypothetical protein ACT4PT_03605 [Methanobacteriota archaeon]